MKLLHTSDWHLGRRIKHVDLHEDHSRFLDWLIETMRARQTDALIVAGDVFHYAQPSNQARALYYRFLARCHALPTLRAVVVVGGNHDSPTGIDAPAPLLDALDIHAVGTLPRPEDDRDRCLVPVRDAAGDVQLVVAAVPYVQDSRLGLSMGDGDANALRAQYREAFSALYTELADRAVERWPGTPIVATGHLTVYGSGEGPKRGDFETAIHRTHQARHDQDDWQTVGTIEALDPGIFDDRFAYVALGHIHRPMPVGGRRNVRYAGTPVATSRDEASPARIVIEVECASGDLAVETLRVPTSRDLLTLEGALDDITARLEAITVATPLPPLLFIDLLLGEDDLRGGNHLPELQRILDGRFEADQRPIIVELRERSAAAPVLNDAPVLPPLEDLEPIEVFRAVYRRKHGTDEGIETLLPRFREVESILQQRDGGDA